MRIFLAITSYEGKIYSECAESLLLNVMYLKEKGYSVKTYFHSGDCFIARARNVCAHLFLHSDCQNLVFIDSDVAFEADSIYKLIRHDKAIVAGAYPYKGINGFPVVLKFDPVTNNCLEKETGLVTVESAPAGFMRIQRSVLKQMIDTTRCDSKGIYSFFDTGMIFNGDTSWYGEDVAFCKRWKALGGEIWVEPRINFTHIGTQQFKGNYHEFLSAGG